MNRKQESPHHPADFDEDSGAAEIEVFGEELGVNTGARSDIENSRNIIRQALESYAMGRNLYRRSSTNDGEEIIREQFARARDLIAQRRPVLEKLAQLLEGQRSLDKTELERFFAAESV